MQDGVSDILGDFHPKPFPLGKATACAGTPVLWTDFYRLMTNHFTHVEVQRLVLGPVFLGCMELVKGLILTRDMVAMIDGTQLHLFFFFFFLEIRLTSELVRKYWIDIRTRYWVIFGWLVWVLDIPVHRR